MTPSARSRSSSSPDRDRAARRGSPRCARRRAARGGACGVGLDEAPGDAGWRYGCIFGWGRRTQKPRARGGGRLDRAHVEHPPGGDARLLQHLARRQPVDRALHAAMASSISSCLRPALRRRERRRGRDGRSARPATATRRRWRTTHDPLVVAAHRVAALGRAPALRLPTWTGSSPRGGGHERLADHPGHRLALGEVDDGAPAGAVDGGGGRARRRPRRPARRPGRHRRSPSCTGRRRRRSR